MATEVGTTRVTRLSQSRLLQAEQDQQHQQQQQLQQLQERHSHASVEVLPVALVVRKATASRKRPSEPQHADADDAMDVSTPNANTSTSTTTAGKKGTKSKKLITTSHSKVIKAKAKTNATHASTSVDERKLSHRDKEKKTDLPLHVRIKDATDLLVEQLDLPGPRLHAIQQLRDSTGCATYVAAIHSPILEEDAIEWIVQISMHLEQMIMDQCKAKSNPGLSPHQWVIRLKGFLSRVSVREWMQMRLLVPYLECVHRACHTDEQRVKLACRDSRFLFDSFLDHGSILQRNDPYDVRPVSTAFVSASVSSVGVAEADRRRRIAELSYDAINKQEFPDNAMNDVRLKRCPKCNSAVDLTEKQLRRVDEPSTWFWKCPTKDCDTRVHRL